MGLLEFFVDLLELGKNKFFRVIFFLISIAAMVLGGISAYKGYLKGGLIVIAFGAIVFIILLLIGGKKKEEHI